MKNNSKSVRLSDEVYNYVIKYPDGDGFNQKFENLVLFTMKSERERKMRLEQLDREISVKISFLKDLSERINKVEYIDERLEYIKIFIDDLVKVVDDYGK